MGELLFQQNLMLGKNQSITICCLWSEKSEVESLLSPSDYFVVGNLYSPQGINVLIRNLLLHPNIRFLILTGSDRNKTGLAVKNLFEKGMGSDHTIIGTKIHLDEQITYDDIAFLSLRVKLVDLINQTEKLKETVLDLKPIPLDDQFLKPREVMLPVLFPSPYQSNDPHGFFLIRIEDCRMVCLGKTCFSCIKPMWGWKEIVIDHYSKDGIKTEHFVRGKELGEVWTQVQQLGLISNEAHREYIENEIQKAFEALKSGKPYIQKHADLLI